MKEIVESRVSDYVAIIKNVIVKDCQLKSSNSYYHSTDPSFMKFFAANRANYNVDVFYQGLNMIYGWMPTMPQGSIPMNGIGLMQLLSVYEVTRNDTKSTPLSQMKVYTSNSIVGLSKILHFMNPDVFPIRDSNC